MAWTNRRRVKRSYKGEWPKLRLMILDRDGRICGICHLPGADQVDHKDPLGSDDPSNLRAAHKTCNLSKAGREDTPRLSRKRAAEPHPGMI